MLLPSRLAKTQTASLVMWPIFKTSQQHSVIYNLTSVILPGALSTCHFNLESVSRERFNFGANMLASNVNNIDSI